MIAQRIVVDGELALVPRKPADADAHHALIDANRTDLRRWLDWADRTRDVTDSRRYATFAAAQFVDRTAFAFTIELGGKIAGSVGVHQLDWTNRRGELGYWLAPEARGRGAMTRACAALATLAFHEDGLQRLEIRCALANRASRAVAERLGFAHEGDLARAHALHGDFLDVALYAMTPERWFMPLRGSARGTP